MKGRNRVFITDQLKRVISSNSDTRGDAQGWKDPKLWPRGEDHMGMQVIVGFNSGSYSGLCLLPGALPGKCQTGIGALPGGKLGKPFFGRSDETTSSKSENEAASLITAALVGPTLGGRSGPSSEGWLPPTSSQNSARGAEPWRGG